MYKRGLPFPDDDVTAAPVGGLNIRVTAPPSTAPFNMLYGGDYQPPGGFSQFTPIEYQHFPYTFASASPPTYSWANTNSTDIMKFTGSIHPEPLDTTSFHHSNFRSVPKRKFDLDTEFPQPPKMRITEDKVSASLREMHISKEFTPCSDILNSNVAEIDMAPENPTVLSSINTSETSKTEAQATLVMCEELRKLNKIDSIVPQPFLNVERPSNAVVLWRKPKHMIEMFRSFSNIQEPESTVVITEITDEELNNQNEMTIIEDNNGIAIDDVEMEL